MHQKLWLGTMGLSLLALGGWVFVGGRGTAGEGKELKDGILKIAESLKKGDRDGAAKQAQALGKKMEELHEMMEFFKKRDKGGWGVGSKPGVVTVGDGIELKLIALGRDAPAAGTLKKEGEAYEETGYIIAAIGEVTKARPDPKAKGKKDWAGWSEDMVQGGLKFSEAAKKMGAQDVKAAAAKLNASCNACHSMYRK